MDLIVRNASAVVTMNARRDVIPDGEVILRGDRILSVGPRRRRTPRGQVLDAQGKVVLPGLIHSHLHACQTLCRNQADGLELLDWLEQRVWPYEAALDRPAMRASADLTFLECLRSGATAVLDMGSVHHYDAVFESALAAGLRLVGGKCLIDTGQTVPARLKQPRDAALADTVALIDTWHGLGGGRLRYAIAPRFALSCTEPLLREVSALASARGVRVHTHTSENATECELVRQRTGKENVEYLAHVGLLGPATTLAHAVWLTSGEQRLLADTRTCVAHCPSANLKLASGIAKVPELLAAGVTVGLGADGAPCNNNLDIWVELRLAALLHKPRLGPTAMKAMEVLELGTLNGARALGQAGEIGALEPGMKADLILVDPTGPHLTPAGEIVSTLVYSAQSRDVTDVIIDGELVVHARRVRTMDEAAVRAAARRHASRVLAALD